MKILMVCLGNICRSPLAEGILRHKIRQRGLDWEVDSAGTGHWHVGELPDPRSMEVAAQNGIDISYQRARHLQPEDLGRFDLVFAMDASNYQNIVRLASSAAQREKVQLIRNMVLPAKNLQVPDPYYGGPEGFQNVFDMLDEACEAILARYA